jgi:hypothetical protein
VRDERRIILNKERIMSQIEMTTNNRRSFLRTFTAAFTLSLCLLAVTSLRHKITQTVAAEPPAPMQPGDGKDAPHFVDKIPAGYRDWKLVSVAHEEGNLNSLGAILGNDVAIKAYREGKYPFPDGTIIAALHWRHASSEENNKIFGRPQSFVAGSPTNVQFMVKDSKNYAATGGWGFGHFDERDDKPAETALLNTCYPCHKANKDRDLVFTRYAP